jgi:uncharacterized integral membrane protein
LRTQLLFVLVVLVVLAAFAALNWTVLAAPAPLNVLVARIEAPPGLVMLAVAIALTLLYLELLAQRKLADDAEASRFTALRSYLEGELAQLKTRPDEAVRGVMERVAQVEQTLRREIQEAGNTLAAYIGEVEDRLTRGTPP